VWGLSVSGTPQDEVKRAEVGWKVERASEVGGTKEAQGVPEDSSICG
jgi:hypothetical protein